MSFYKEIFKNSGIIGLVQVSQMFLGLLRNKTIAIALGTSGFGLWGLYQTYIEMFITFSVLGLDQSGVRQIAKKSYSEIEVAKCIWVFKRILFLSAFLFSIVAMCLAKTISNSLFGTEDYFWGIIIATLAVMCNSIARGQISILNGLGNLRGLSLSQIVGTFCGVVSSIVLIIVGGVNAIPFALLSGGLFLAISTWWYVRKMRIAETCPSSKERVQNIQELFKIGIAFASAGAISTIMTFFSRVFLSNEFDVGTVGIYMASWTISNLYIGIILNAMGVDFVPRLMKISDDNKKINQLVNEQIELGVLITGIAVVAVLIFSPLIMELLYSSEFVSGTQIIRWQILGVSMRVIAFPFGFVIMAKAKSLLYIIIQTVFGVCEYLLLVLFARLFGFEALGVNYVVAYLGYLIMVSIAGCYLFSFSPSLLLRKILLVSWFFIIIAWFISSLLPWGYSWILGTFLLLGMAFWVNHWLVKYMNLSIVGILKNRIKKS